MAVRNPDFFRTINKKYRRYHLLDCERVAAYLGIPYRRPMPDPIIQNLETNEIAADQPHIRQLTRLGAAAQELGMGLLFVDKVARLLWDGSVDGWNEGARVRDAITSAGLDGEQLLSSVAQTPGLFESIIDENQRAFDESDHWGVPTFVFRDETFYGQDRLDLLLWRMQNEGLIERSEPTSGLAPLSEASTPEDLPPA